jgi:hypothetical protein
MGRPYSPAADRPRCLVPECPAPRTLSFRYTVKNGEERAVYRRYCSWHHTHGRDAIHPLTLPQSPTCQAEGCTRAAQRRTPRPDGSPAYALTCRDHTRADVAHLTNPHVAAALAELSPAHRRAENIRFNQKRRHYVVGKRSPDRPRPGGTPKHAKG